MIRSLWRLGRCRDREMSAAWLRSARADNRNTFEGVSIQWPIKKTINDAASFNTRRLRKRA